MRVEALQQRTDTKHNRSDHNALLPAQPVRDGRNGKAREERTQLLQANRKGSHSCLLFYGIAEVMLIALHRQHAAD